MNPRLYQAMDLLYMPLMDLQQYLKEELLTNPFLDMVENEDEVPPDRQEENEQAEAEKENDENEIDWEDIILDGFSVGSTHSDWEEKEFYERVPVEAADLSDHLADQLQMLELNFRQHILIEEIIGNIGEDGYLKTELEAVVEGANRAVSEIYREMANGHAAELEAQFDLEEAEAALQLIQSLEPPGIGARNLRECILLQLRAEGDVDSLTYTLVDEHFDDLIAHRWSDLAKRCGLDPRDVQDAADAMKRLDPKPGLRYSAGQDIYVTPDLVVEKIDGEYRVFLNDTGMPRLRISRAYQELAADKKKFKGENKEFVTTKLNSASWLIQAIEQRRQTMLKVMNFIVDRQRDFFERGVEALKPLTLREVADVIGMHESTVSRVTNQKYCQTPRGVFPLKYFFSSSLGTSSGEDASARAVKAQIQKLVADENSNKPLTDSQIGEMLKARGIQIARRTVAKYRDQLGILPARMRKRV